MEKQKINITKFQKLILIFMFFVLIVPVFCQSQFMLYADDTTQEIVYSNVLDDLKKDSTFNADNYPIIENDYSLKVIQIAESVNNELFVYVYQPLGDKNVLASSISLSLESDLQTQSFMMHNLTFINSSQTLFKYKVNGIKTSSATSRYYEISSIYRKFIENVDINSNNNLTQEVAYPVNKVYVVTNNSIECHELEFVQILEKYVGFVRYDGEKRLLLFNNFDHLDSHFIAFSTNKQIDCLMEADVYFQTRTASYSDKSGDTTYGSWQEKYSSLNNTNTGKYESGKWSYSWKEIQSVDEFISSEHTQNVYDNGLIAIGQYRSLTTSALEDLKSKQWVLRFYESSYTESVSTSTGGINYDCEEISKVSLLRLKFQSQGGVYNLGVVDNKTSNVPDAEPDNKTSYDIKISNKLIRVILSLFAVFLIIVLILFAPVIFTYLAKIIEFLIKAIIWIISLPIKIIQSIFSDNNKN